MKQLPWTLFGVAAPLFLILQVLPGPASNSPKNPPIVAGQSVRDQVPFSPAAAQVIEKSCINCHSNETKWPWYSRVAPASWLIEKDVQKARRTMNFSDWATQKGRKPETAIGAWQASCIDLQQGRMPPKPYLILHPEARLSHQEIDDFCQWTKQETARLIQMKRARLQKSSFSH